MAAFRLSIDCPECERELISPELTTGFESRGVPLVRVPLLPDVPFECVNCRILVTVDEPDTRQEPVGEPDE